MSVAEEPNHCYASILVDAAIDKVLDYAIPRHLAEKICRGCRVTVPLRHGTCGGIVLEVKSQAAYPRAKAILEASTEGCLPEELMLLAEWMASYYATPLRIILKSFLPPSVRKDIGHREQLYVKRLKTKEELRTATVALQEKAPCQARVLETMLQATKGLLLTALLAGSEAPRSAVDALIAKGYLAVDKVIVDRSPLEDQEYFLTAKKTLTMEQERALAVINETLEEKAFRTHLLYGITGSGKTEVYLQAIDKALSLGKTAILMVPEIALTTQTVERLRSRFQDSIAVLHCRLSAGERYDAWHKMRRGDIVIAVGARSAIFAPLPNLGLIIVDEEHENSYKQSDQQPCYQGRDVAVMRGKLAAATVVLGSATPSFESFHNAATGKYSLLRLSVRPDSATLPTITVVDMKREYEKAQGLTSFSQRLLDALAMRLGKGEQAILFLNRRGYYTLLLCQQCGENVKCSHCDTTLTFHLGDNCLSCHLCGFTVTPPPRRCPSCKSESTMKFRGVGTEHVERALHAIFPQVRTLRIDADTTKHKGSHQQLFRAFGSGKADVLIGTQMIAKGLHFPEVTLAAILNGDSALHIPDYRAAETTFQLLTQVAGRAGRGVTAGEVIIQTALPDHSVIQYAASHNFEDFYQEEMEVRALFGFPPFSQLLKVTCSGLEPSVVEALALSLRHHLLGSLPSHFAIHPVVAAAHLKVKDRFRYQFLVRGPSVYPMVHAYNRALSDHKSSKVTVVADVNPSSTFF